MSNGSAEQGKGPKTPDASTPAVRSKQPGTASKSGQKPSGSGAGPKQGTTKQPPVRQAGGKQGAEKRTGPKPGAQKQPSTRAPARAGSTAKATSAARTKQATPGRKSSTPAGKEAPQRSADRSTSSARKEAQRQGARRPPRIRGGLSARGSWAVAVGAFLLTVADLPKIQYSDWAPEAGVALIVGVAGLPLLVARAIGRGGSRRATSEIWAARLAIGFVAAGVVSAAFAASPTLAAFGLYQHGTGWIFMALLAGWWALGTGFGPSDRHLLETALVAGAVVNASLAVLQQLFGLTALGLEGLSGQPDGFLGNPVFLGGLLTASLVLLAPRFAADPRRWWLPVTVVGLGLGVDGERLPALLAVVVVAWLVVAAWSARRREAGPDHQGWRRTLEFAGLIVATLLVGSGLAKIRGGIGVVSHTASSSSSETFGQRFHAWSAAVHAFAAHPILGSGPGQFRAATSAYFSAADIRADGAVLGTFPDAHNFIVEYATTTGIIGLGLLVAWLVFSVRGRSGPLLGFAAVIGAMELAEPLNVVITPLAFIALGGAALQLGSNAAEQRAEADRSAPATPQGLPRWAEPAGVVLAVLAAIGALLLVIGDISYESARADAVNNEYSSSLSSASTANSLMGEWPDPATELGAAYFALTNNSPSADLTTALHWAKVATGRDPTNAQLWTTIGQYQGTAGNLDAARASALKALEYQPTYPPALNVLGIVATQEHHNAQAESWFERSLAIEPDQSNNARLLAELKKGCTAERLTAHAKGVQLRCPR